MFFLATHLPWNLLALLVVTVAQNGVLCIKAFSNWGNLNLLYLLFIYCDCLAGRLFFQLQSLGYATRMQTLEARVKKKGSGREKKTVDVWKLTIWQLFFFS